MARNYRFAEDFAKQIAIVVIGYHQVNKKPVTFKQVAEYLSVTSAAVRMRFNNKDCEFHNELTKFNIKCKREGKHNVFFVGETN